MAENKNGTCDNLYKVLVQYGDLSANPIVQTFFGILYMVILVLGVTGNSCVILAVRRNRALHSVRNLFIVSLSCSDISVCLVSGTITPITAFAKIWLFGKALCKVVPLIQGTTICISTFTLAAISIDRLILIVFPTHQPIQQNHAICMICAIWAAAIGLCLPAGIYQFLEPIENWCYMFCKEKWPSEQSRKIYGTAVLIIQFLFPLLVIALCYGAICLRLSQGMLIKAEASKSPDQRSARQTAAMQRRQRTNRMLIAMVFAFACSWCPQVTFNLARDYNLLPQFVRNQEYVYGIVMHCIAMSSTCWNPVLYAWLNEQLRSAFLTLLPKCCSARNTNQRHLLRAGSRDFDHSNLASCHNSPLLNSKTCVTTYSVDENNCLRVTDTGRIHMDNGQDEVYL